MSGFVYVCVFGLVAFFALIALSVMWVSGQVSKQDRGEK